MIRRSSCLQSEPSAKLSFPILALAGVGFRGLHRKDIVVVTALTDGDEVVLDSDEGNFISKFRPLDHDHAQS